MVINQTKKKPYSFKLTIKHYSSIIKWYYIEDSNDRTMKTGWQKINGYGYYFGSDGAMVTGWFNVDGYS